MYLNKTLLDSFYKIFNKILLFSTEKLFKRDQVCQKDNDSKYKSKVTTKQKKYLKDTKAKSKYKKIHRYLLVSKDYKAKAEEIAS